MKSRVYKIVALFLSVNILAEVAAPMMLYALTGGPSQPEMAGFTQIGVSDMVDIKTGDFSYNIPLMDVGGYPLNLAYSAGPGMDDEASWVGLGWSLNPGVINRSMKGIPDDFKGDDIKKEFNIKDDETYSVQAYAPIGKPASLSTSSLGKINEILGFEIGKIIKFAIDGGSAGINGNAEVSYNTYSGIDFGYGVGASASMESGGLQMTSGLSIGTSAKKGLDLVPNLGLSHRIFETDKMNYDLGSKIGLPYNSRQGIKQLTLQGSISCERILKRTTSSSFNGNSGYTFVQPSYTPYIDIPREFRSTSLAFELGEVNASGGYQAKWGGSVTFSESRLAQREKITNAYGSLYSEYSSKYSVMDFNREKDGQIQEKRPYAGVPISGTDQFIVQGQGISGTYKVQNRDLGTYHDPYTKGVSSASKSLGAQVGGKKTNFHLGVDFTLNHVTTSQGVWNHNKYDHTKYHLSRKLSAVGETVPQTTLNGLNEAHYYAPSYFGVEGKASDSQLSGTLSNGGTVDFGNLTRKEKVQNNPISYLTALQASQYGSSTSINSMPLNSKSLTELPSQALDRRSGYRRDHHISEMRVTRADGSRYIYGIPAYNNFQREVTFSVDGEGNEWHPNYQTGLVQYNAGTNPYPESNTRGQEHYVERIETPGYAHSYLLTNILSADYVDRTGNGISDDDFGSYTKFNYTRLDGNYRWRVPITQNHGTHSEGLKSVPYEDTKSDDKASYLYGEKEIWMVHSIETKTHVALFTLGERQDAKGVLGEHGGVDNTEKQYRLERIDLYTKEEFKKANPVAIKSVHFEYSYQLCPGIENSSAGKLTLTKLYFTYGTSNKGRFSAYKFSYNPLFNFGYNIKAYDRWGTYKPNNASINDNPRDGGYISNAEFPYTIQDPELSNKYAAAWCLNKIELPSGGEINVEYESDDYSHVQNKAAMQMFALDGAYEDDQRLGEKDMLRKRGLSTKDHPYLFFKLKNTITSGGKAEFKKQYLRDIKNLYFRALVNIGRIESSAKYEYVSGYGQIDDYGISASGEYGWVKLKPSGIRNNANGLDVNPITKAAWHFLRMHRPEMIHDYNPDKTGLLDVTNQILSIFPNIAEAAVGINTTLDINKNCHQFSPAKSFIRLYTPDGIKLGGGHRVKRISINDKWDALSGGESASSYGQEYDYKNADGTSSGVASYEPLLGGDENPHRQPIFQNVNNLLVPDDEFYVETPLGEGYFPSPQVIYGKVKVTSLNNNFTSSNTGYVVNEFYTTKDFPTITSSKVRRPLTNRRKPNNALRLKNQDYRTFTQGFVIELNSIAGQAKSTEVFNRSGEKISGVKYFYKTEERKKQVIVKRNGKQVIDYVSQQVLSNEVDVLMKNPKGGSLFKKESMGLEIENYSDSREYSTNGLSLAFHFNSDLVTTPIGPLLMFLPMLPFNEEKLRVRILTHVKVIQHNPILEKVIAYEDGSEVETENLLYDELTGDVLLTRTTNQYGDPVYNFSYPAHFAYDRMAHAYKNEGYKFEGINFNNVNSSIQSNFISGDELRIATTNGTSFTRAWVVSRDGSTVRVMDDNGDLIAPGVYRGVVLRSGRRNMQSTPIGTVTTLSDPRVDTNNDNTADNLSFSKVINAGSVVFSDDWKTQACDCGLNPDKYNPFLAATRGNWRVQKSYAYLTERTQSITNNNTDIRHDGIFKTYSSFWLPSVAGDWSSQPNGWQFVTEVTAYSPNGYEIENKDALGRFSSASYGYYAMLPVAVHNNAQYKETVAEGFEDYFLFNGCMYGRKLSFDPYKNTSPDGGFTTTSSHTGRYSMKVNQGKTVKVVNNTFPNCE